MNKPVNNSVVIGAMVVLLIGLAYAGYHFLGGRPAGQKPKLDPVLEKMYKLPNESNGKSGP